MHSSRRRPNNSIQKMPMRLLSNFFVAALASARAEKVHCDKLMEEFRELNEKAARAVQERMKGGKQQ